MKKNRTKILTAAVIILTALIIGSLVYMNTHQKKDENSEKENKTSVQQGTYESYRPDSVDFGYIIATIHVTGSQDIPLDHFTTDEGIRLNQVKDYLNLLNSQGTDTNAFHLDDSLHNGSNTIFIPFKDKSASSLEVTSDLAGVVKMHFDIAEKSETASPEPSASPAETQNPDVTIVEQDDLKIGISRIFEIDPAGCTQNGQEAMLPSSARIFAAEIEILQADSDVTIESAQYTADGMTFNAEDSSFASPEYTTAVNTPLKQGDKACVYFILIGNGETEFSYNGTLSLKIAGRDEMVNVETTLS